MQNFALRLASAALFLSTFAVLGCDKDSTELGTKDIEATYTIELDDANGKQETKVEAKLRESDASAVGPQGDVNLAGGDTLTLTTDKNDNLPIGRDAPGTYRVTLPNIAAGVFTFSLKRATGSSTTVFNMHPPLAFTDSPAGKSFPVGSTIHFAWSNPAMSRNRAAAKLFVSGSSHPCGGAAINLSQKQRTPFDDTGSLDIPLAQLYSTGSPSPGDCVDIEIERKVIGDADRALDAASSVTGTRFDRLQIKVN